MVKKTIKDSKNKDFYSMRLTHDDRDRWKEYGKLIANTPTLSSTIRYAMEKLISEYENKENQEIQVGGDINEIKEVMNTTLREFKDIQQTLQTEIRNMNYEIYSLKTNLNEDLNQRFNLLFQAISKFGSSRNQIVPSKEVSLSNLVLNLLQEHKSLTNVELMEILDDKDLDYSIMEIDRVLRELEHEFKIKKNEETNHWRLYK